MGNGMVCAGLMHRIPINAKCYPFTVFLPQNFQTAVPLANKPNFSFVNMLQFLAKNPRRIGLYLRCAQGDIGFSTSISGQSVSLTQCLFNDTGRNFEAFFHAGDPQAFVQDAWFVAATAAFGATVVAAWGIEVITE